MPGEAILNLLGRQSQRQRREQVGEFFSAIRAAGSRERALEVVKNYSSQFSKPNDYSIAFRTVDEFYPEPSKEIKRVDVYNRDTGESTPRFISSGDIGALEDPAEVERRFGVGSTLTKPDLETFYSQPDEKGRVEVLGKLPVSQRPKGAVTLPELTEARRVRSEEAQRQRDELSRERFEKLLARTGEGKTSQEVSRGRSVINDATRLTAMMLGGKFEDGIWIFDDRDMEKLFASRIRFIEEAVKAEPKVLDRAVGGIELFNRANKAMPVSEAERPPPPKPPAKPEPGLLSRGVEAVKGALSGKPAAEKKAPTSEDLKKKVESAGWKYEPDKYEYRTTAAGKLQRRLKK